MLKETFQSILAATRNVFGNWRPMLLVALVYAFLLAVLYIFVVVREASMVQVVVTFVLALAAPLLFFLLQSMIVGGLTNEGEVRLGPMLKRSLTNLWKLILVTLPLIALTVLIAYLLTKAQARFGATLPEAAAELPRRVADGAREAARPIDWRAAAISTVRYLMFGLVLPLAAIHIWLATAREGLRTAVRKIGGIIGRAFSPQSVLIYVLGFIVFGVIPYFILFKSTSSTRAWLELSLFVTRLAAVFALTLLGWVITVKALSSLSRASSVTTAKEVT